ncbi:SPOR domain-containing protein [bacterium]|nr:SPOR domain-containing protein [bacterium]
MKRLILIIFAFSVVTLPAGFCQAKNGMNRDEEAKYSQAIKLFNQHEVKSARQALTEFQKVYPGSRWKFAVQLRLADLEPAPAEALKMYNEVLTQAGQGEWEREARWGLASSLFVLGRYKETLVHMLKMTHENENPWCAPAFCLAGQCQMALKKYPEAQALFSSLIERYPQSPWVGRALAGLGDAELGNKNIPASLKAYNRYLREFPKGDLSHLVLHKKARVLDQQNMKDESAQVIHELVTRYSDSYEAQQARNRLSNVLKKFTIQVGAFSQSEYAAKLEKKLRQQGYNAYTLRTKGANGDFYQVRVGSYTSREFADKFAEKLHKKEKLPFIVMPYIKPPEN